MIPSTVATNQQLAKILERQRILPPEMLDQFVNRARTLQEWLGQVIVDEKLVTFEEIARAIAQEFNLPMSELTQLSPSPEALRQLPSDTCRSHGVLPIAFDGSTLRLAMANPLDEEAKSTLRTLARAELSVQVAPMDIIMRMVEAWYQTTSEEEPPPQVSFDHILGASSGTQAARPALPASWVKPPSNADPGAPLMETPREDELVGLDELLIAMHQQRASDLHLAVGSPPMIRVDGELRPMPYSMLKPRMLQEIIYAILTDVQITAFERHWELDFAYSIPRISRFRVNVHRQRGSIGAVLRTIPEEMPTLDKLGMPPIVREMTLKPRGLVLVTGPTGSGKSTTLAAMIDEVNRTTRQHIVTVEDPIEFLHKNKLSIITQREVGADTESFATALRHVLRQDPDVILIGEMRDLETIGAAVTAAETGHLVFATLHTTSAAQTIERIIDVFPPHQQEQIRSQLSNVLEGIITQTLLPNIEGKGRSCAQEILTCTPAIRNLIREGKIHQMPSVLQASAKYGMQTLDQSLKMLVLTRKVSLEAAILKSSNADDFKALVAMQ